MGLFTPKWMKDKNATEKLTREQDLLTAALEGKNADVRMTAVMKLKMLDSFYRVVQETNAEDPDARDLKFAALNEICAKEYDTDRMSREMRKISGFINSLSVKETVQILRKCHKPDQIHTVLSRVEIKTKQGQEKLRDIYLEAEAAKKNAKDQKRADRHLAGTVLPLIRDPEISMELLRTTKSWDEAQKLYENLSDAQLMELIDSGEDRFHAVSHLQDRTLLEGIVRGPAYPDDTILDALRVLKDPELYKEFYQSDRYSKEVKKMALYHSPLSQDELVDLFWKSTDKETRMSVLRRITDKSELTQILETVDDEKLRQEACGRLGHKKVEVRSWDEHARHSRGYRSHTEYRCTVCGKEFEEVEEHDS